MAATQGPTPEPMIPGAIYSGHPLQMVKTPSIGGTDQQGGPVDPTANVRDAVGEQRALLTMLHENIDRLENRLGSVLHPAGDVLGPKPGEHPVQLLGQVLLHNSELQLALARIDHLIDRIAL